MKTFKEWEKDICTRWLTNNPTARKMIRDWKAERENYIAENRRLQERVGRLREYSEEYVQQRDEAIIAEKAINEAYLHQYRHRKWALEKLQTLWLANNHLDEGLKKAEAELVEAGTAAWKLAQENQRLQERVGELEEFVSDVWFYADRTFLFQRAGELLQKYDIHIPAQAQTKEGESGKMTKGTRDVINERQRQIEKEGWTANHDDLFKKGQLAAAAMCYIEPTENIKYYYWPWDEAWWKPKDERRNLVRAAALVIAEIDRLDRQALQTKEGE